MADFAKQVTEQEVREVARRLRIAYAVDKSEQLRDDPLACLVRTLLSQNTSDRNRDVAMASLQVRFAGWEAVADAPLPELIDAIRATNYSTTKAQRLQVILRHLRAQEGRITLDFLRDRPTEEAERYLLSLKGIGKKSAACVLAFALGRAVFPVDTHVRRVGIRLGWLEDKMSDRRAHERMRQLCPPELTLPLHFGMWAHGHFTCRPKPRCARCPIYEFCLYEAKTSSAGIPLHELPQLVPLATWTPTFEEQRRLPNRIVNHGQDGG